MSAKLIYRQLHASPIDNIVQLQSDRNYTYIHFAEGPPQLLAKSLWLVQTQFNDCQLLRVSRSVVVNTCYIEAFQKKTCTLQLRSGQQVAISKRRLKDVLAYFKNI